MNSSSNKWRKLWVLGIVGLVFCFLPVACHKDEVPPTVTITTPADGDTVYGYVTIMVEAVDEDSVESITLFINDYLVAEANEFSLSYVWNTTQLEDLSTHIITATSLDPAGNEGESDPITVVVSHRSEPPETPSLGGPTAGFVKQALTFWATTTDPTSDDISYQFDWGDGSDLEWSGFIASGDTIYRQKTFDTVGTYKIKVKAKDKYDAYSEYSSELTVEISEPSNAGSIQVNSTPSGADIWLDGVATEKTTPSLFKDLAAGDHTVGLRLERYADYQTTVTVVAEQTTTLNATLERIGELVWRYETGGAIESSPAIGSDGTIYIGSGDNKLYAIDLQGNPDWEYPATMSVNSPPAVGSDGKIYFGSDDTYFYILHPEGVRYREYKTEGYISSSPALGSDGTIYVGSGDGNLWALTPEGKFKWKYITGNDVTSSAAIGTDGTIYVGSDDNYLYAINPADGSEKWSYETGAMVQSSPAIGSDGTIYFGSQDRYVYALDPADGNQKWSYETDGKVNSSPAIGEDGTIYIGSDDNYLYAFTPAGTLKWQYETGWFVRSSPAVGADGTIYFGSVDGYIYALRADGTLKWRYETGDAVSSSPAIGADGTIYCGSMDHSLYALSSDSPGLAASPWPKFCHDKQNTGRAGD